MVYTHEDNYNKELKVDCEKCFGLCCIALYFSASEGFPINKDAGKACINLQSNFTCSVHKTLRSKGLKGCTAYDCFGAGQKVAQITCGGNDWRQKPESANRMFDAFLIMRQLHEMLWYINQALGLQTDYSIKEEIVSLIDDIEHLTLLNIDSLLELDVVAYRNKANIFLKNTSELVRTKACREKKINSKMKSYFGKDLRKTNLIGADLRGACLIASNLRNVDLSGADFIGADLRDADLSGANLSNSIFLTQAQINVAKGDSHTKLPNVIVRPKYWSI
ncbi:pentapeptide repeat-containing protein [Clostridium gasigenes]|uniref:pentapeptide repeat-containing protein n=1 Tax=Clostridium gasigenes TaxID=94869 RepID=UPI001C0CAE1F|nr:pentapeptide repeat-containing protein [Clostridium gasigenes]MBU3108979.1 pentapeptide repeat-containing protein [Clostridium gasigenes]